jgi:hypothetical protein
MNTRTLAGLLLALCPLLAGCICHHKDCCQPETRNYQPNCCPQPVPARVPVVQAYSPPPQPYPYGFRP